MNAKDLIILKLEEMIQILHLKGFLYHSTIKNDLDRVKLRKVHIKIDFMELPLHKRTMSNFSYKVPRYLHLIN